jgi:O-antigen/teichoic acid export membrane protein
VVVPLVIGYVGIARYGAVEAVWSLGPWTSLAGLGTGLALMNGLTDRYVDGDRHAARRLVASLLVAAIVGTSVMFAMALTAVLLTDPRRLFDLGTESIGVARAMVLAVVGGGLIAVVSALSGSIYGAYQEPHRNNLWDGAGKLATIGAVWLAVRLDFGLAGVAFAFIGAAGIVRAINLSILLTLEKPWLFPRRGDIDAGAMRTLLVSGLGFVALQFASMAIVQSDRLVVAVLLGTKDMGPYAVVSRVLTAAYGVVMLVLSPLWPAHGEALRRGDVAWVRRTVTWSLAVGLGLIGVVGAVLIVAQKPLLRMWLGSDQLAASSGTVVALTLAFASRVWIDARSVVLNSVDVVRPQLRLLLANAALFFLLAWLAAPRFGIEGVAWALPVSSVLTTGWGYPWLLRTIVRGREHA